MQKLLTHKWLILSLIIAALAGRMLLTPKHFYTHDDIQVFRVNEFISCFQEGQIPCRWSHNLGKGYGYPWFNYYPPMIYVVPAVLSSVGVSLVLSLNLFMFATFLLAAWSMYALVKELTDRDEMAALGSVLFTLYPFHATNVFVRGVYAENLAWSFAPLILLLVYRQLKSGRTERWLPFLFGVLYLTHIISSFVLTGFVVFWAVCMSILYKHKLGPSLLKLATQIFIGIGLAAFFFGPAIFEKNLVQSDSLTQGYFAYTNHYVSSFQLFKEYKWNYEGSFWNEAADEMPFMVGHVHTALLIFAWLGVGVLLFRRKILSSHMKYVWLGGSLSLAALGFLFLAHFKSDPLWSLVPALAYVQFPWRFIVWAGIPLTLSIVLLLSFLPKKIGYTVTLATLVCLLAYSYPFFFPRGYDSYSDADLISGSQETEQQSKSLYDYLPVTVHQIPTEFKEDSAASYPVFYFPGWSASAGGQVVAIGPDPVSGLITPTETFEGELVLAWGETPFRLAMDLLSLSALLGYGFYLYKTHVQ